MQIPNEIINKWLLLRSEGDADKIAEVVGVHAQTIRNAFNTSKCSDEVFEAMGKFYANKEEKIKQFI